MSAWLIVLCYSFVAYGASNIIVFGSGPFRIFEHLRSVTERINPHFGQMFSCMMCLPANFGWICSLVNRFLVTSVAFTPFNMVFQGLDNSFWNIVLLALCDGAFTSGIVWFIHHIEEFFENLAEGRTGENDGDDIIEVDG